ncbi:MAG: TetR/AcrR family transcriptional regulator [Deltaproteobacteria bacterium]|nr:TetR/AcrR family transcriptional regulator [Deltaproteobacteria bacterium]
MTKHRKREEWIEEILEAAADELVSVGYSRLTMEAIAARTDLSKGGVYRFFSNKREIALALFTRHYRELLDFEPDEVIVWNLPITETLYRLLFEMWEEGRLRRDQKVWVQLISETLRDEEFTAERERLLGQLREKFGELVKRLFDHYGIETGEELDQKLDTALRLGIALLEGLVIQGTTGTSIEEQAALVRRFIEVMLMNVLGEINVDA